MANASWLGAVLVACATCVSAASSDMDPTWDPPGGYTVTNAGANDALANAVAIDSHGRVVLGGYAYPVAGGDPQFTAVRYYGDETPAWTGFEDAGFHNNINNYDGISFAPAGIDGASGFAVQISDNDSVVIAGDCTIPISPENHAFCLARFTNAGAIDATFGSGGTVVTRIGPNDAYPTAMAKDSTGALLVAGYSADPVSPYPWVFTVVRYDASGNQDMSFGVNGVARVADPAPGPGPGLSSDDKAYAIAIDSDDSIIVAGAIYDPSAPSGAFGVVRLTKSGVIDPLFNSGNMAVATFPNGSVAAAVGVDALHRVIVGGTAYLGPGPTMALARFTASGSADATFGSAGKVYTAPPGCTSSSGLNALAIDRSNRIFAAGYCHVTVPVTTDELALVHYNGNGAFDSAYGTGGVDLEYFSTGYLSAIVLDTLGRPVVAGTRYNGTSNAFVVNRHDYVYSHGFE